MRCEIGDRGAHGPGHQNELVAVEGQGPARAQLRHPALVPEGGRDHHGPPLGRRLLHAAPREREPAARRLPGRLGVARAAAERPPHARLPPRDAQLLAAAVLRVPGGGVAGARVAREGGREWRGEGEAQEAQGSVFFVLAFASRDWILFSPVFHALSNFHILRSCN